MRSLVEGPIVFVDTETTGMDYRQGRIIEIAAVRYDDGQETDRFSTLLDPQIGLNPFITQITGITPGMLEGAPLFAEVADRLHELLNGAVLIAHNVRFDYSFLKHEFKRLDRDYSPKMLCTVRLSRALYPQHRKHGLDSIIERHGLATSNRHRALDDTLAIVKFFHIAYQEHGEDAFTAAAAKQIKRPSLPSALTEKIIDDLPEAPGVYVFEDEQHKPLYIGKSVNIRKRVLSHFSQDHASSKELKIAQHIKGIKSIETHGELGALLLESRMVKDLQPLYNRKLRRHNQLCIITRCLDESGYFAAQIREVATIEPHEIDDLLAVYTTKGQAKKALMEYRAVFDLCPKLLGLEKTTGACFLRQLKKCRGACLQQENPDRYNLRFMSAFSASRPRRWPYDGPIVIEERSPRGASGLIVDQWCIMAELEQEQDNQPTLSYKPARFDLDSYKILRSFVGTTRKALTIRQLDTTQFESLMTQEAQFA